MLNIFTNTITVKRNIFKIFKAVIGQVILCLTIYYRVSKLNFFKSFNKISKCIPCTHPFYLPIVLSLLVVYRDVMCRTVNEWYIYDSLTSGVRM